MTLCKFCSIIVKTSLGHQHHFQLKSKPQPHPSYCDKNLLYPRPNQHRESTETQGVPWRGGTLAGTLSQHRTHGWARAGSWHHSTYRPPRSHHSEHTSHMWTSPLGSERTHTHSRTLGELDIQTLFFFLFFFLFWFFCFLAASLKTSSPLESGELGSLCRGMAAAGRGASRWPPRQSEQRG